MRNNLLDEIKKRILICDGAIGSQLVARGLKPGECPDQWNITHPEKIKEIHRNYIDAGADIILTHSFTTTRWNLEKHNCGDKVAEFNKAAVKNAREAADKNIYVFGDIGPTGVLMEPYGEKKFDEFYDVFTEQVTALNSGEIDAAIIQTMFAVEELQAAVKAIKDNTDLPIIASAAYSPDADGKDFHTIMGITVEKITESLLSAGANIIGANCGSVDIKNMVAITKKIRNITDLPIIIQPNAGTPKLVDNKPTYEQTPEEMVKYIDDLIAAGANIIGGCCGTTPEHIRAFAAKIKNYP